MSEINKIFYSFLSICLVNPIHSVIYNILEKYCKISGKGKYFQISQLQKLLKI